MEELYDHSVHDCFNLLKNTELSTYVTRTLYKKTEEPFNQYA
jgi:hypothetical protein